MVSHYYENIFVDILDALHFDLILEEGSPIPSSFFSVIFSINFDNFGAHCAEFLLNFLKHSKFFPFLKDFGGFMAIWTRILLIFSDTLYAQFVLGKYQNERSRWVLPRVRQGGNILLWILWCCSAAGPGLCLDQHQSAQSQSWPLGRNSFLEYDDFLIHVSARNKQI